MELRDYNNLMKKAALCFLAYFIISIPVILTTFNFLHVMIIWNLFLSILPLTFAWLLLKNSGEAKKPRTIILCILWLFFFPNAPYMITDFIHLSGITFYSSANPYAPVIYSTDIVSWIKLTHIGVGVLFGTLTGLLSLYIVHQLLIKTKGKITANIMVVIICLLSGYAIYIGRFLRFNSWDILRPMSLLSNLISNMNMFAVKFSLLFALYVLATYCIFYTLYHSKEPR